MITATGIGVIYRIVCIPNGRTYIGSTNDLTRRKSEHLKNLRGGGHCNPMLQKAFNKYGESSFEFSVIETAEGEHLIAREQFWLDRDRATGMSMNLAEFAQSGFRGRTWSAEQRAQQSERAKARLIGKRPPFWGCKHTEETKRRISEERKGKWGVGSANGFFGEKHSEETRGKMRDAHAMSGRMKGAGNINYGKRRPPHVIQAISRAQSKAYTFRDPLGKIVRVFGLKPWCAATFGQQAGTARNALRAMERGTRTKHYMGWTLAAISMLFSIPCFAQILRPPPAPDIAPDGLSLILSFEVGDDTGAYYKRFLTHPEWPGASSGVTVGIGWDAGYNSAPALRHDWGEVANIDEGDVERLAAVAGITGQRAKAILYTVRDIYIGWPEAQKVFRGVTLARFWELTRRTYPGFDDLRPNAQAALLSLVFNRGSSLVGGNRREMRAIRPLVVAKDYEGIAAQIRSMKRIWAGTSVGAGLIRRREAEAKLVLTP
jgi:group I intron endonuclease